MKKTLSFVVLLSAIIILPGVGSAQTADEQFCYVIHNNLSLNSSYSNDVIALRHMLYLNGYGRSLNSDGVYSDKFDREIHAKTRAFQRNHGVQAVGNVGVTTRAALREQYGCDDSKPNLTVLHPQNVIVRKGSPLTFQWLSNGILGVHKILLIPDDHNNEVVTVYERKGEWEFPLTASSYKWPVPDNVTAGVYKVYVQIGNGDYPHSISDAAFAIAEKSTRTADEMKKMGKEKSNGVMTAQSKKADSYQKAMFAPASNVVTSINNSNSPSVSSKPTPSMVPSPTPISLPKPSPSVMPSPSPSPMPASN